MKRIIEFPLEDGNSILVEVEEVEETGTIPASRRNEKGVPEKAQQTFETAVEKIRPAAAVIVKKLRALHDPPDQVTVEFGMNLNAQAGAIIAAASTEANYKITLTWKREEQRPKAQCPET